MYLIGELLTPAKLLPMKENNLGRGLPGIEAEVLLLHIHQRWDSARTEKRRGERAAEVQGLACPHLVCFLR
jgi:hypothetical protein